MTTHTSRRRFVGTVAAGAAGLGLDPGRAAEAAAAAPAGPADAPVLQVGENVAVVETRAGKVRGYVLRGVHHYLGIPYGADTSGAGRFLPPQPRKAWSDVFPALWWGNSAPQNMERRYANAFASFRDRWNYDDVSEDCLRLNVFTPAAGDGRKRPVMFWIHGGGFTAGNAIEQDGYHGESFARFGDAVFVSINHRLGPLGYCDLSTAGERFASSGNVGMLDIVAALEWVRDNVAAFGGDPGNVTIMGQSGGGAKVCALLAMPSAKGLFHKAVVLSGASLRMGEKAYAEKLGGYVLREAGLSPGEIDKLQYLAWPEYLKVASRAAERLTAESGGARGLRRGFNPVVDGRVLPQDPFYPEAAPTAADVPLLVCSTFHEISPAAFDAALDEVTLDEVAERVKTRAGFGGGYGERAREVVEAYARAFPGKKPSEIWALVSSTRQNTVALADAKAKQTAPVYVAWFGWQPPMFDGRMGAFHCLDICFWFHNTDLMWSHTGGGARPRKLAEKMAGSLLQFMKAGDPNGGGLPKWPRYTSARGETMVLDDVSLAKDDPDREARKALPPV
jgi:para-nitrobenzyl esterase